jgi:hypothetical protein
VIHAAVDMPGRNASRAASRSSAGSGRRRRRLLPQGLEVEAAAVVGHAHLHGCPPQHGGHRQPQRARLARRPALRGRFGAVVHGVADQVAQRVLEPFEHRAIQFHVAALHDQLDLLAGGQGQVAHHAIQSLASLRERQQPDAAHLLVDGPGRILEEAAVRDQGGDETVQVLLELAQVDPDAAQRLRGAARQPAICRTPLSPFGERGRG